MKLSKGSLIVVLLAIAVLVLGVIHVASQSLLSSPDQGSCPAAEVCCPVDDMSKCPVPADHRGDQGSCPVVNKTE